MTELIPLSRGGEISVETWANPSTQVITLDVEVQPEGGQRQYATAYMTVEEAVMVRNRLTTKILEARARESKTKR